MPSWNQVRLSLDKEMHYVLALTPDCSKHIPEQSPLNVDNNYHCSLGKS